LTQGVVLPFLVPALLLFFRFFSVFISLPFFVLPFTDPPLALTTLFTCCLLSAFHCAALPTSSCASCTTFSSSLPSPLSSSLFHVIFHRSLQPVTSHALSCRCPLLLAFLFLSGDIELNPGPVSVTLCTLNIRSILHPLHSAALSDLIDVRNPDLFCLTETWIKPTTTSAELLNCTPPNYTLLSVPRNHSGNSACIDGGTGFLIREPFTQLPTSHPDFSSFESSSITLQLPRSKISVCNIYRPPSSSPLSKPNSVFLEDFHSFFSLSLAATTPHEFIITGDFSIHLDNHADHLACQFLSLLWLPYGIGRPYIFSCCGLFFFLFYPRLISAAADWMSAILPHMVWP